MILSPSTAAPLSRPGLPLSARSRSRSTLTRAPRRSTPTQQSSARRKVRRAPGRRRGCCSLRPSAPMTRRTRRPARTTI
eukprot:2999364-Prymnesium_polylepis.1